MSLTKLNTPRLPYTGEGFKGERALAILAVSLTIVSSVLLIQLCLLQRRQIKDEMAESKRKKEEAKNNATKKT